MQFFINNWHLFVALIAILAALALPMVFQRMYGIESLSPAQATLMVNRQSGVMVDISDPKDYGNGHIPNSMNAPLATLGKPGSALDKYKERPVVVVCPTGSRSLKAAALLRRNGWKTVHLLAGGVAAWQKQGLPLEK